MRRVDISQSHLPCNSALAHKLQQMNLPLSPLVQITTGEVHPDFPRTVLQFWLLSNAKLEGLAHFYHQRTLGPWSSHYPYPVSWRSDVSVEEKRSKFGIFIGLREYHSSTLLKNEEEEVWRKKLYHRQQ